MSLAVQIARLKAAIPSLDSVANALFGAAVDSPPAPEAINNTNVEVFLDKVLDLNLTDIVEAARFATTSSALAIVSDDAKFYTVVSVDQSATMTLPEPTNLKVLVLNNVSTSAVTISFESEDASVPLPVTIPAGGQAIYAGIIGGPSAGDNRYEGLK